MKTKRYLGAACLAVLVVAAAFALGRYTSGGTVPPTAPETAGAESVNAADVREFMQAVSRRDFAAMERLGEKAFVKGRAVENVDDVLAGYETNSFPPYTVYALFTDNTADATRRVLLTLDADNRVESFMAEEMAIIK